MSEPAVHGTVAPGFDEIVEAFEINLATGEELGAQLAVYRGREALVDLRGGVTATGDPLPDDALYPLFSVTKGVLAGVVGLLLDEGLLELDAPVARSWPEFAAAGKDGITLAQLLAHQAGIPGLTEELTTDELLDPGSMAVRLAAREPVWEPGSAHGYHAIAIGYLVGELVRRIAGESVGQILRERIAVPRALEVWVGLPADQLGRVERMAPALSTPGTGESFGVAVSTPGSPTWLAFGNPPIGPGLVDEDDPIVRRATIDRMRTRRTRGLDRVIVDLPTAYGALFMLASPVEPMTGTGCFGHNGIGGSLAFADPATGVGVAYLTNRPQMETNPFPKVTRLMEATRRALAAQTGA